MTHRELTEKARKDWNRLAAGYKAFREEQGTYNELVEVPAMLELIGDVKGKKNPCFHPLQSQETYLRSNTLVGLGFGIILAPHIQRIGKGISPWADKWKALSGLGLPVAYATWKSVSEMFHQGWARSDSEDTEAGRP